MEGGLDTLPFCEEFPLRLAFDGDPLAGSGLIQSWRCETRTTNEFATQRRFAFHLVDRIRGRRRCSTGGGRRVYVNEWVLDDEGNDALGIRCLSASKGETLWAGNDARTLEYEAQDVSESYPVRPIARLCQSEGRIVSVSYGGIVSCIDTENGKLLWQHDLVGEYEATPMQYGFASTPWCDGEK